MKFSSSHVYLINQKPKIYKKKRTYSSVIVRQHDLSIKSRPFNRISTLGKRPHPRAYSGVTRNPKIYSSLTNTARRPRHASNTTKTPDLQPVTDHGILTASCHYVATATWRRLNLSIESRSFQLNLDLFNRISTLN